jgi:D-cysteine desulfhydrase family pyridoxal phosphate-dependent enzyme
MMTAATRHVGATGGGVPSTCGNGATGWGRGAPGSSGRADAGAFPRLEALPRCALAALPTPVMPAPELGGAIGLPNLWIKRDDLIPFGFGGNKVRGLEFIIADALACGADIVLTGAGAQSNHVRATAAAATWAHLDMIAVYWGDEPAVPSGNFALTRLLGAHTRFTSSAERASVDRTLCAAAAELRAAGRRPYVIPRGGACALGVTGHIIAVAELAEQCHALGIAPDTIVLAVGSGGTFAGWLVGIAHLGLPWRLEGFTVSRPAAEVRARIVTLAAQGAALAGLAVSITEEDVRVHDGFLGPGYGIASADGDAAVRLGARTGGVFFDPTYTGKAFAGLSAHARSGRVQPEQTVVFVHTGGQPALFATSAGESADLRSDGRDRFPDESCVEAAR